MNRPSATSVKVLGVAARYGDPGDFLSALKAVQSKGYDGIEAYSPFPVEGCVEILHLKEWRIPWIMLAAGVTGSIGGFMMQYAPNVWWLPLNIGGRPHNSWPAFIPITFELTILSAAIAGFIALLARCRLPEIYHPAFGIPGFERASLDSFFVCVWATDQQFNVDEVTAFLKSTNAQEISSVGAD